MPTRIGVRELKNQTSAVIRQVREAMAEYVVTVHGEPVAVLRPLDEAEKQRLRESEIEDTMAEMKALAREIGAAWTSDRSAVELIEEQRR